MAKTSKVTQADDIRALPWNLLVRSEKNVRHVPTDADDKDFTADIARRGVLQSLLVRPQIDDAGAPTGRFQVTAGGRRYEAVGRLIDAGTLPADTPLPCKIRSTGIAEEDSLAENVQRAPLHPLDQYRGFVALIETGLSEDEVAARFFVPVTVVRQRLKLASVSPALLDAFGRDEMPLELLMAFTVNPDHMRQEQVWEAISKTPYGREPYHIRRLLSENTVKANDKRALFVGAAAYVEAGGTIARDLFEADEGGWFQDTLLLERLVQEKLDAEVESVKAEGWLWVEAAVDHGYGHTLGLRQFIGDPPDYTDEEIADLAALTDRFDTLIAEYEGAEELPDDIDQQFGELEEKIEAYRNRPIQYDPAEVARAGVFISLNPYGGMRIERGFVRPEDEPVIEPAPINNNGAETAVAAERPTAVMAGGNPAEQTPPEEDEDELKPLSDRLLSELTAFRTVALRNTLAEQPRIAMTLLLHKLCCDQFYRRADGHSLDVRVSSIGLLGYQGLSDSLPAEAITARNKAWLERLPDDVAELWDWLGALDQDACLELLAHCLSYGINALYQKPDRYGSTGPSQYTIDARMRNADHLAAAMSLDVNTSGWHPTAANYFANVSKVHILRAIQETKGDDAVRRISGMKKADMAAEAEILLADTGWLPEALRTPGPVNDRETDPTAQENEAVLDGSAQDQQPTGLEAAE